MLDFASMLSGTRSRAHGRGYRAKGLQTPRAGKAVSGRRYYSPSQGRFLGRDPVAERGGLNLYVFVENDAINRWDLIGLKPRYSNLPYWRDGEHGLGYYSTPAPLPSWDPLDPFSNGGSGGEYFGTDLDLATDLFNPDQERERKQECDRFLDAIQYRAARADEVTRLIKGNSAILEKLQQMFDRTNEAELKEARSKIFGATNDVFLGILGGPFPALDQLFQIAAIAKGIVKDWPENLQAGIEASGSAAVGEGAEALVSIGGAAAQIANPSGYIARAGPFVAVSMFAIVGVESYGAYVYAYEHRNEIMTLFQHGDKLLGSELQMIARERDVLDKKWRDRDCDTTRP